MSEPAALTTREAILQVMRSRPHDGLLETTIISEVEALIDVDLGAGRRKVWPDEGERDTEDELYAMVTEGIIDWNPDDEEVPDDQPLTYRLKDTQDAPLQLVNPGDVADCPNVGSGGHHSEGYGDGRACSWCGKVKGEDA